MTKYEHCFRCTVSSKFVDGAIVTIANCTQFVCRSCAFHFSILYWCDTTFDESGEYLTTSPTAMTQSGDACEVKGVSDPTQEMLDSIEQLMRNASHQTASRPSGTRVLQVLVTMLARQFLTEEQQRQVESIQDIYDECVSRNGEMKHWKKG
jgi:hypothetical protein